MTRIIILVLPALGVLFALAGCSSTPGLTSLLTPYRIDIRQGNFVTPQMVALLKPGQTQDQVRFILGTPLLTDPFHADRWDYVYRFQPGRGELQQRRLTVHFEAGKLTRFDGDVVADPSPAATQSAAQTIEIGPRNGVAPVGAAKPGSAGN